MIDIKSYQAKALAGTASIVRLRADFPEAAQYAVYEKEYNPQTGAEIEQRVTGIRLMDVDEFRAKLAEETAFLAELDAMEVQP